MDALPDNCLETLGFRRLALAARGWVCGGEGGGRCADNKGRRAEAAI